MSNKKPRKTWYVKELSDGRFGVYTKTHQLTKIYNTKTIAQNKLKDRQKLGRD